jgi:hypothetical protein
MMYLKLILLSKLLLHPLQPLQPLKMLPQTLALLLLLALKLQLSVGIDWKAQLKVLQLELV